VVEYENLPGKNGAVEEGKDTSSVNSNTTTIKLQGDNVDNTTTTNIQVNPENQQGNNNTTINPLLQQPHVLHVSPT
jgi:hypothetical protein